MAQFAPLLKWIDDDPKKLAESMAEARDKGEGEARSMASMEEGIRRAPELAKQERDAPMEVDFAKELEAPAREAPMREAPAPERAPVERRAPSADPEIVDGQWVGDKQRAAKAEANGPDWLMRIAAFTHSPVLAQAMGDRNHRRAKQEEYDREAPDRDAATKRQATLDGYNAQRNQREQEKWEAEKPLYASGKAAAADSKSAYAQNLRQKTATEAEENDPQSPVSKQMSTVAATSLMAQAQLIKEKNPAVADMIMRTATTMQGGGVSAKRVKSALDMLGKVAPQAAQMAQQDVQNGISQQHVAQGWAGQAETKRHNLVGEEIGERGADRADAGMDLKITKPQEKLNKEVSGLETSVQQMQEALTLKKNVNTGPIIQKFRDLMHLDKFDEFTAPDRAALRAIGAKVFNKELHELSGAAVSPSEWARIEPQIPGADDDDDQYVVKMNRALKEAQRILGERRKEYQLKGGQPTDGSTTAKEQHQKLRPTLSTPKGTPHAQDSEAVKWAKANPGDPRARVILEVNAK